MKKFIIILFICLPSTMYAQFDKISGGLKFSSGVDFNTITTGNPGMTGAAYFGVMDKAHFVPSISVFNVKKRKSPENEFKNYMFQADLDFHYELVQEGDLRLLAFGGFNMTGIISKYEMLVDVGQSFDNDADIKPGANIGASVEMYIDRAYDAYISAKYIAGNFEQFVISLGVVYNFGSDRRKGW